MEHLGITKIKKSASESTRRRGDRLWEPGVLGELLRAPEFPARLDLRAPGRRAGEGLILLRVVKGNHDI